MDRATRDLSTIQVSLPAAMEFLPVRSSGERIERRRRWVRTHLLQKIEYGMFTLPIFSTFSHFLPFMFQDHEDVTALRSSYKDNNSINGDEGPLSPAVRGPCSEAAAESVTESIAAMDQLGGQNVHLRWQRHQSHNLSRPQPRSLLSSTLSRSPTVVSSSPTSLRPSRPSRGWSNLNARRSVAEKLTRHWRVAGGFGILCLLISTLSLIFLSHQQIFLGSGSGSNRGSTSDEHFPEWFDARDVPQLLRRYVSLHHSATSNPGSIRSRFLVHEMPRNETQVTDALLGLVSSFMLAVVTDRALLVQWTPDWKTPLDELSVITGVEGIASSSFAERPSWFSNHAEASTPGSGNSDSSSRRPDSEIEKTLSSIANFSRFDEARRVALGDVLSDPGFSWDYDATAKKYTSQKRGKAPTFSYWDPLSSIEDLSCKDLKDELGRSGEMSKFVKVGSPLGHDAASRSYYMPFIQVNPNYSEELNLEFEGGLSWAFSDLFNFLVRPVPEVLEAIDRFKVRSTFLSVGLVL